MTWSFNSGGLGNLALNNSYNNNIGSGLTGMGSFSLPGQVYPTKAFPGNTGVQSPWPGSNSNVGFDWGGLGGTLSGLAAVGNTIMGGITGLQSMNLAKKNLGLAKEQFGFQKALANRNLANQAKIINNTYDTAASVAGAQAGKFGMIDQAVLDKYAQVAKDKHVSGEAI